LVTLVVATATSALAGFAPILRTSTCTSSSNGPSSCSSATESLVGHEGRGIIVVLAVPILIAAVALFWRSRRVAQGCAIALSLASFIALASVGIFLIPTVICAWIAVATSSEVHARSSVG
jgi:hypothetical protein